MKFCCLRNSRGVTLVELMVAWGLSSVLLVMMVSGSLFIQSYLSSWSRESRGWEELVMIQRELAAALRSSREVTTFADSLLVTSALNATTRYAWAAGSFSRNGRNLLATGLRVDELCVVGLELDDTSGSMVRSGARFPRWYRIEITVSDERESTQTTHTVVRNSYGHLRRRQ